MNLRDVSCLLIRKSGARWTILRVASEFMNLNLSLHEPVPICPRILAYLHLRLGYLGDRCFISLLGSTTNNLGGAYQDPSVYAEVKWLIPYDIDMSALGGGLYERKYKYL